MMIARHAWIRSNTPPATAPLVRTLIYGTGAVGGYYGGRLLASGAAVTFVARGAQLAALQSDGLRLISVDGDYQGPVTAVGSIRDAPPADLALCCVKAGDTRAAAADLARHLPHTALVVSFQNGVENVEILARELGTERVLAATLFIGARVQSPGVIRHSAAGQVRLGHYPDGTSDAAQKVVVFMKAHGIKVTESQNIRLDLWKKLLWNVGFNGPSALSGKTVGQMLADADVSARMQALIHEAAAAGRAAGVDLPDGIEETTFGQTRNLDDFKTSMLQDVEAGRPIENDAFYGCVMRTGSAHGIDTPVTRQVHDELARRYP